MTVERAVTGATKSYHLGSLDVKFEKGSMGGGGEEFYLMKISEQVVMGSISLKTFCEALSY